MADVVSASTSSPEPAVTVDPEILARTLFVMTLAPMITVIATLPEPAMLRAAELIRDSSEAVRSTPPAAATDPPSIVAAMVPAITFPKPVALTATYCAAPTPTLSAMIPESVEASRDTDPPEVTSESTMSALTVFTITLPETAPLTATPPEPEMLARMARILVSRSKGDSSTAELTCSLLPSGSIHSGMALGAMSLAERLTPPAAVIVEPPITEVSVLVITFPSPATVTATAPDAETPTEMARMTFVDSEARVRFEWVARVESVTAVSVVFVMSFTTMGTVTAAPPVAATPTTKASMVEVSLAVRDTAPPASTAEFVMVADVVSTITLAAMRAWTAAMPDAPTPVAKA